MYINGRKITLEDLELMAERLIGSLIDDVYNSIQKNGVAEAIPGSIEQQVSVLKKMMKYYVDSEQYEKCAAIRDLIKITKALQK